MTTPAQIAANRRNALKSTGPQTETGKAASAQNALRHGLTARKLACEGERQADFAAFAGALRRDLAPIGEVEEQLAEHVILAAWRLRRAARAETSMINSWHAATSPSHLLYGETPISRLFTRRPESMLALARYEAGLDRSFTRALALLERRQARRRGEPVPAPVTVLVESADELSPNFLGDNAKIENCETNPILERGADGDTLGAPAASLAHDEETPSNAALCAPRSA
ncbi:MAG TPA: hypothetical protein VJR47_07000 [Stellaceae bacterium]|nr:hypothetical protein [Stellaceae bacterium]